ncbi:MAG: endolytic transglycosylase MltG [Alicyclobacillaceae bacterium]|nr:endolytic transglycosylase MltG [Alicyclobacillaceae bacterium]
MRAVRLDWRKIGIIGCCAVLLAIGLGAAYAWFRPVPPAAPVTVTVAPGSTVSEIAAQLQKAGLIRHTSAFQFYVWATGLAPRLQAGQYRLTPGTGIPGLAAALAEGRTSPDSVRITIPEGYTVEQVAKVLESRGICSREAFLQEVDHGRFESPLLSTIPADAPFRHRLEGYLFPDTYVWMKGTPPRTVIEQMIRNLERHIPPSWVETAAKEGRTWHEIMTVASMVEREAKVPAERPIIAGVIYNRLAQRPAMPLQIDATVQYVVGQKEVLTFEDLRVPSPYNTYARTGLPPGPIANPGLESIRAAVFPSSHSYYYYVAKGDGSGEHYFAQTYAEHLDNEKKAQASRP